MKKKEIKNLPASIHARLKKLAEETNRSFNEVSRYYAMERFLNRLSHSQYRSNFILKGGLAFWGWGVVLRRVTNDIDFQVYADNSVNEIVRIVKDICAISNENEDGMIFDAASVKGETIMNDADYQGVRIRFMSYLGSAEEPIQIDTSFANIITPKEVSIEYPSILGMPGFELKCYNPETAIAEKVQAMIFLGSFNDRMRDFYDIYLLAQECEFDGSVLVMALTATFNNRKTSIPLGIPVALSDDFVSKKQSTWQQFMTRVHNSEIESKTLNEIIDTLRIFLLPPLQAAANREQFEFEWKSGNSWLPKSNSQ